MTFLGLARERERFAAKRIQGENCYEREGARTSQGNQGRIENQLIFCIFLYFISDYLHIFILIYPNPSLKYNINIYYMLHEKCILTSAKRILTGLA